MLFSSLQNSRSKGALPTVNKSRHISSQVARLIKNKIQPLSYKHSVFKSSSTSKAFVIMTPNKSIKNSLENPQQKPNKRRRNAFVKYTSPFSRQQYDQIHNKVQNHIMLKRMNLIQGEYAHAEQCNKKQQEEMRQKLRTSPLQKYLQMFEMIEKPTEKINRVKETTCQEMLKQIKSAKSIKFIQCMQDNMKKLQYCQSYNPSLRLKANQKWQKSNEKEVAFVDSLKLSNKQNRKLRREIMNDIKKQYQNQSSSKIRISINHKKMIQI